MALKVQITILFVILSICICSEFQCPVGSYLSKPDSSDCSKCANNCDKCTGPTYNQCIQFSKQLTQCYEGAFMGSNQVCQSCAKDCKVCTGPSDSECLQQYYVPTTCQDGMFLDENSVCQNCSANCQICEGPNEGQCTKKYYVPTTCYEGKFLTAEKSCQQCFNLCKTCSGPSEAECQEFYPVAPPPTCEWDGYFKNSSGLCEQCHVQCSQCQGASFNSCMLFYPTSPEAVCPITYFKNKDVACQKCIKNNSQCLQCTGPSFAECQVFQPLDCGIGQYFDNSKDSCENCIPGCAKCSGPEKQQCSQCLPGYIKNANGDCSMCSFYCTTCLNPSICQVCDTTFFAQPNGQCAACTSKCNSCIGPSWAECHTFQPGVLNELQSSIKEQADSYYMHYDTSSSSLVDNVNVNGHSQFIQCNSSQLDSELAKYNFPSEINQQIESIVFMEQTAFQGFKFLLNNGQASEQQIVGCARNVDGTIQIAVVQVSTTGSMVQQYDVHTYQTQNCHMCWHFWHGFRCCNTNTQTIRTPIGFTGAQLIQIQQALQAEANIYIQNTLEFPPASFLNYQTAEELKQQATQIQKVQS